MFNQLTARLRFWYHRYITHKPLIIKSKHGISFEYKPTEWVYKQLRKKQGDRVLNDDPRLIAYLERTVKPGDVVFDVGSSTGTTCMISGKLAGEEGQVYAFEAESGNYAQLCRNIELNKLKINPNNLAVYSSNGTITLNIYPPQKWGWHSIGSYESGGFKPVDKQQVGSTTLDQFCLDKNISKIDLMKIDIEGAEPEAFAGAARLLKSHSIEKIIFEISLDPLKGMGHVTADVVSPLLNAGYKIYEINRNGTLNGPKDEFNNYKFTNLVALAPN